NPIKKWLVRTAIPLLLSSPFLPAGQRRILFGAPLPPIDPPFSFREPLGASAAREPARRAPGRGVAPRTLGGVRCLDPLSGFTQRARFRALGRPAQPAGSYAP